MAEVPRLTRGGDPAAPVRMVHLGVGAFHRAHQAFYTQAANDADPATPWGIAGFTGRKPDVADQLRDQDGLYTLITRGPVRDEFHVMTAISEAHDGASPRLGELLADPHTAIVTMTVTEKAYADAQPTGPVARLVRGLAARQARAVDSGKQAPIAVVSADNLSGNGEVLRAAVHRAASQLPDAGLADWLSEHVSFVTTMVDRITPATTSEDIEHVAQECHYRDASPVVTEPFHEWILQGDFPAGRPAWEAGGAQFVSDIEAFERRKLWLLNGSHSALAYAGQLEGHQFVDEAIADPRCMALVAGLWDAAAEVLPFSSSVVDAYRDALTTRYRNPRLRHALAQIAQDGSVKLGQRIMPAIRARFAAGLPLHPSHVQVLAAWAAYLDRGEGVIDPGAPAVSLASPATQTATTIVGVLAPDLVDTVLTHTLSNELHNTMFQGGTHAH